MQHQYNSNPQSSTSNSRERGKFQFSKKEAPTVSNRTTIGGKELFRALEEFEPRTNPVSMEGCVILRIISLPMIE